MLLSKFKSDLNRHKIYLFLRKLWWLPAPLFALLAFLPILNIYFSGEDFVFIKFATSGKPFYEPIQNLFYRPLPNLLWQLDYNLWGLQAAGYHLTNLIIHCANVILVGWLAKSFGTNVKTSTLTAVLFALNPIHTEPVVWLSARPDLVATFFSLGVLLCSLKYFESERGLFYALSIIMFVAGLLSKESTISLPIVLFFLALAYKKHKSISYLTLILRLVPFLIIDFGYLILRISLLGRVGGYDNGGNIVFDIVWNLTIGLGLPYLFPVNLESVGLLSGIGIAFGLLILYLWIFIAIKPRPLKKFLVSNYTALILIFGTILPALINTPVAANMSQSRVLYLPSVGFCLFLANILSFAVSNRWIDVKSIEKSNSTTPHSSNKLKWLKTPITYLLLFYLIGLFTALPSWMQAGNIVKKTFTLFPREYFDLNSEDTIYYEGLPDSFQGAYIWRNGLDEATQLIIGKGFRGVLQTGNVNIDYQRAEQGRLWFARYGYDANLTKLSLNFTYNLSTLSPIKVPFGENPNNQIWNFESCQLQHWALLSEEGRVDCQQSKGILFNTLSKKTSLTLISPLIKNTPGVANLLEFDNYIDYDFQQLQIPGEVSLKGLDGKEYFHQTFYFAATGKKYHYQLFISDLLNSTEPFQVQIKLSKFRSNILWGKIGLGVLDTRKRG